LGQRLAYVANHMASRQYLVGEHFTVADAYLYTVLTWTRLTGIDLAAWPVLAAYRERIQQRPAVQAARKAEGLKA
jgi:glutathione S-transferase